MFGFHIFNQKNSEYHSPDQWPAVVMLKRMWVTSPKADMPLLPRHGQGAGAGACFWGLNLLAAVALCFTYSKKSRIAPLVYLAQQDQLEGIVLESGPEPAAYA